MPKEEKNLIQKNIGAYSPENLKQVLFKIRQVLNSHNVDMAFFQLLMPDGKTTFVAINENIPTEDVLHCLIELEKNIIIDSKSKGYRFIGENLKFKG